MSDRSDQMSMPDDQPVRAMLIPLASGGEAAGLKIADLGRAIQRLRFAVFGIAIVCGLATLVLYLLSDNKYRATTTFILAEQSQGLSSLGSLGSQLGGFANLAGLSLPGSSGIREEAFASLESRQLLRDFIVDEDLKPVLFADDWDGTERVWLTESGDAPSTEKTITFFQEKILSIKREPNGDAAELSVTWSDPQLCERWANDLVRRVNEGLRQRAITEARGSIEYLEEALKTNSNAELQSAIFALIEQQMAASMMANVRSDFAFRVIDTAVIPDADNRVSPRLLFYLIAGGGVWFLLSGLLVVAVAFRNRITD